MYKVMSAVLLLVIMLAMPGVFGQASAAPAAHPNLCGDLQPPDGCSPRWREADQLRIKSYIPFAWLRNAPSSYAGIVATTYPSIGTSVQVVTAAEQTAYFDGYQWWWHVRLYPSGLADGWVEQASMEEVAGDPGGGDVPPQPQPWRIPTTARVVSSIPFLWLRTSPASNATFVATLWPASRLIVVGGPVFDNVQWWWQVAYLTPSGWLWGYVEQTRIEAAAWF